MKSVFKFTMAASLLAMTLPAQSQILWDTLVDNTLNFYEDQDREGFFDVDGDGALSEGDVALGYSRLDDRTLPLPGVGLNDELYGIFSIQVQNVVPNVGATNTTYGITYEPTSVPGLRLSDFGVTNTDAVSMGAVFEDVNRNLISELPTSGPTDPYDVDDDGRLTIFDFILEITNDTQDLVVGLENGLAAPNDHFFTGGVVNNLADPIANLALLESSTIQGGLPLGAVVDFHAGLGITWAGMGDEDCPPSPIPDGTWCFGRLVEDDVENPVNPSLHELAIQNGDTSGAADLVFGALGNPYFSGLAADGTGQLLGFDFYGVSTNADFALFPVHVPEPGMIALMGMGLFGVGAMRRRRKA